MAIPTLSYSIENDKKFFKALDKAARQIGNLKVPLQLIAKDFYESQKAVFQKKGPGLYPDLAESTKEQKQKNYGFVYPILKATGRLAESTLRKGHPDAIYEVNETTLIIGTKVPYGIYHQSDEFRKKIPLRKFLFIGPEAKRFANDDQIGRLNRWLKILKEHTAEVLK